MVSVTFWTTPCHDAHQGRVGREPAVPLLSVDKCIREFWTLEFVSLVVRDIPMKCKLIIAAVHGYLELARRQRS